MGLPLRRLFFLPPSSANPAWCGTLRYGPARHGPRRAPCQDGWVPPAPGHMVAPMPAQVKYPNAHTDGGIRAHACTHTRAHMQGPPTHLLPARTSTTRQVWASGAGQAALMQAAMCPHSCCLQAAMLPAPAGTPCLQSARAPAHAPSMLSPTRPLSCGEWGRPGCHLLPPIPQPPTHCVPARARSCNQRQPPAAPCPPPAPVLPCWPPRHCCRVSLHFSF